MEKLQTALQQLQQQFTLEPAKLVHLATDFHQEMLLGLTGKPSSLKMLPSYLARPTGEETGTFLALDFGGTNVRVILATLCGQGVFTVLAHRTRPLKDPLGNYNYISGNATATALFDFIATQIAELIEPTTHYPLGHTFSFPTRQLTINDAIALEWSKEINTTGVVGQNVNQLLTDALTRHGCTNVHARIILNDTVGTLLAAAYLDPHTDIGSICGTGHNTAYLEPHAPETGTPMIINIESGNFDKLPPTTYDEQLDHRSEKPGIQQLEKMCSGRYLGELVRLIAVDFLHYGLLKDCAPAETALSTVDILTGADIAILLADTTPNLTAIETWLAKHLHLTDSILDDRLALQQIATLVVTRSARIVAATYLGILHTIDPTLARPHTIGIDGSLYEKMPLYKEALQQALDETLLDKTHLVKLILSKDGSGIGAAIAVAIVQK